MEKQQFLDTLQAKSGNELYTFIQSFGKNREDIDKHLDQYDVAKHAIFDPIKRKDKIVVVPTNEIDADGNPATFPNGNPKTRQETVKVTRIGIAVQQEVTDCASSILCANKIELTSKDQVETNVKYVWDDNKLNLKTLRICNIWLSETEVAELWYKNPEGQHKTIILANSLGNRMFPVFDDFGKMVCFGRTYISQDWSDTDKKIVDVNYCEIYTDTEVIKGNDRNNSEWAFDDPVLHGFDKLPVIYATREKPLWANVQGAIERTETSISNLCDTNDYFGSPILKTSGKILGFASKGEPGKLIEIEEGGDLEYVTWDQAPESIIFEKQWLEKVISEDCGYVNLSPDNLKGLFGSAPSSYAIKLLFTPAHQLAAKHEEIFGEYIQRRINFLLAIEGKEADTIIPKFTYLLPRNDAEEIANISAAIGGGFLSTDSAIEDSPLTVDAEQEKILVSNEEEKKQKQAVELIKPQSFVPVN